MTYILFPGEVISEGGDIHYITAAELADLYGVNLDDCKVFYKHRKYSARGYIPESDYVELHPRSDGNYSRRDYQKEN